jgi:cupin 2 domain-containing protein
VPRPLQRGGLEPSASAPAAGERVETLLSLPGLTVEQILSGSLPEPVSFDQDHDEWVLLLEGRARLLVDGEEVDLGAGDWLFLPARCVHTLLETEPGTSWLAVHLAAKV